MYIRPAAPARIEVSASLRCPPEALQLAHTTTRRVSRSSPVPASLFHPPPTSPPPPESPAARVHRRRRAHPPPPPPTHPRPHARETQRAREGRLATACCAALSRWPAAQHAPAYAAVNPARDTTRIQPPASRPTPSPSLSPRFTKWLQTPACNASLSSLYMNLYEMSWAFFKV
jgi:hypothetical protein